MTKREDVPQRNEQGKYDRLKNIRVGNSIENGGINYSQQYQTILNLYNSGIPAYIIAFQLDMDEKDVHKFIQSTLEGRSSLWPLPPSSISILENEFTNNSIILSPDNIVNTDIAIKNAQVRMWKALRSEPEITLSMERTNEVLKAFAKSKVTLVILNIDLVDSTELSISLPLERLSTILQTFMQEMASVIISYGGYVLKYIGDAVLGFFIVGGPHKFEKKVVEYQNHNANPGNCLYIPCINACNCCRSVIKILDQAINPILNQYGYPEMSVRIGIDIGENSVIQDGWDLHTLPEQNRIRKVKTEIIREPHFDIIGYSTNIAVKMTGLASANKIVIGQSIYEILDQEKSSFKLLDVNPDVWKYIDNRTDALYRVYQTI